MIIIKPKHNCVEGLKETHISALHKIFKATSRPAQFIEPIQCVCGYARVHIPYLCSKPFILLCRKREKNALIIQFNMDCASGYAHIVHVSVASISLSSVALLFIRCGLLWILCICLGSFEFVYTLTVFPLIDICPLRHPSFIHLSR